MSIIGNLLRRYDQITPKNKKSNLPASAMVLHVTSKAYGHTFLSVF